MKASSKQEIPSEPTQMRKLLWRYEREPAGMGEWMYRIYRNNHYMLYAESESIARIIVNGLNRDEAAGGGGR